MVALVAQTGCKAVVAASIANSGYAGALPCRASGGLGRGGRSFKPALASALAPGNRLKRFMVDSVVDATQAKIPASRLAARQHADLVQAALLVHRLRARGESSGGGGGGGDILGVSFFATPAGRKVMAAACAAMDRAAQ